jgi:hypothetical protein
MQRTNGASCWPPCLLFVCNKLLCCFGKKIFTRLTMFSILWRGEERELNYSWVRSVLFSGFVPYKSAKCKPVLCQYQTWRQPPPVMRTVVLLISKTCDSQENHFWYITDFLVLTTNKFNQRTGQTVVTNKIKDPHNTGADYD